MYGFPVMAVLKQYNIGYSQKVVGMGILGDCEPESKSEKENVFLRIQ